MTVHSDPLDVFDDVREVEPDAVSHPSWQRVVLALAGAAVVATIAVAVIANIVSAGGTGGSAAPNATLCGGASSCDDLTVAQVESLTALELPEGTTVTTSSYERTDAAIRVNAQLELPSGSNPFSDSAYFEVDSTPLDVPAGLVPESFYAATGESGSLTADGVLANNAGGQVVIIRVEREF